MSHKHQYLVYYIHLTDKALYDSLALTGSPETIGAVLAAPDATAITYTAPNKLKTDVIPQTGNYQTSEWFGTSDHFPTNIAAFDRKSGGWFGIPLLFGDTTTYHWRGQYTYSPPATVPGVAVPLNIAKLRWWDGFEILDPPSGNAGPENGVNGDANNDNRYCSHSASRHADGSGMAWRGQTTIRTHNVNENLAGTSVSSNASWERFYIRLWQAPAAQTRLWGSRGTGGVEGFNLEINPAGQLVYGWDTNTSVYTAVGTAFNLVVGVWYKVDVRFWYGPVGSGGTQFELWINGVIKASGTVNALGSGPAGALPAAWNSITAYVIGNQVGSGGRAYQAVANNTNSQPPNANWTDISLSFFSRHGSSRMGNAQANTMAIDIDDWICGDHQGAPDGVDFQNGHRVIQVRATGFDAAMSGFTGDWRWCNLPAPTDGPTSLLTSSTNGAVLAVATDGYAVDALPESLGAVAIRVQLITGTGSTNVATNEAVCTGAALSTGAVAQSTVSADWKTAGKALSGTPTPVKPIAPIVLKHIKGSASVETIRRLSATVCLIGSFGKEDLGPLAPPPSVLPKAAGPHNNPYPRTPWARSTVAPIMPVFVRAGTYTGNGTGQDLLFPMPIHFFRARPSTVSVAGGTLWWSTLMASHVGTANQLDGAGMVQALMDESFVPVGLDGQQIQSILRIVGGGAQSNAAGVVYSYIAIGDPGQRFMLNGGLVNEQNQAIDVNTPLIRTTFVPEAIIFQGEDPNVATTGCFWKGKGNPTAVTGMATQGETAAAIAVSAGQITTKQPFHVLAASWLGPSNMVPFSAWRSDDGSSDDVGSNKGKACQIVTYTGDGAASRTIALAPAVGKRPLWALVVPHGTGATYYRDPAHSALGSSRWDTGGTATTAIVGGNIDSISVGPLINTNGIVYDVLVIPGDSTAGNDGWSIPGDFWPVPPDPPPSDIPVDGPSPGEVPGNPPSPDPTPVVVLPDPLPPAGPMPSLTDDLDPACIADTTRMINMALTRIGITTQIAVVATDAIPEATEVRLVYNDAIQQTLRDFAWPFATRYVQLTQVGTTRPNSDWLYAYRQPSDCIFERRIAASRTDVADAAPIPFACSSDATGNLIFTNQAQAVLEYTARPKCPHTRSEPLFREAAMWKLAELLAPGLSRLTDTAVNCAKGYAEAIGKAQLVLRPGNPGEIPATSTYDTTAPMLAANVNVINLALVRIGARTIRNVSTDQSREAQVARIVFEQELRATLRDFPWSFATQYASLALVGGTSSVPVNADWQYSYRLPTDVVFVRRMVDASRRTYERQPPEFRQAIDATGGLLFTDQAISTSLPVTIEYTNRPIGAVLISDALFRDALAWRLAWTMAPSLAVKVPEETESFGRGPDDGRIPRERPATGAQLRARAADTAQRNYYQAISTAKKAAANEGQPDLTNPDADWIAGR